MRSADPDVLIVGAGPAGSIAALILARAGARVRIVDRAQFPRHKLCGDTLNPGAMARLDALGLGERVRADALPVAGMVVTGPGGVRVVGEYGAAVRGAAIVRSALDQLLLDAAMGAGAEFEPGVLVGGPILTAGETRVAGVRVITSVAEHAQPARIVIAADGRRSRLAFSLGIARFAAQPRRWAFGAYYADVDGLTSCGEMHIRTDGYIGVAPLPNGLTNVCVVRGSGRPFSTAGLDAGAVLERAVYADAALRDRFAHARRAAPVAVLGPLAVEARAAGMRGLLLAGDAAGFIDPMTGDGLRFAIRGAELAADCAARELETGRPMHRELSRRRSREFSRKWLLNRSLRSLVARPYAVRVAAVMTRLSDAPVKTLIGVASDAKAPAP